MEIHGAVYLIVGLMMVGSSYALSKFKDLPLQKFTLFVVAGGLFILIGIFKLLKNRKDNHVHHKPHQVRSPARTHPHGAVRHRFCSACGGQISGHEQFCPSCGTQIR